MTLQTKMFTPAERKNLKVRWAIMGPSGSGKTYTALTMAFALCPSGGNVAVIDTEHGACSKYEGMTPHDVPWKFQVNELKFFDPMSYTALVDNAGAVGFDVIVIDSLSHAWQGIGGALQQVENASGSNKYTAWKDVTPRHQAMIESMLASPAHIIATMRARMDYVLDDKNVPQKVGLAPVQRNDMEYEFDVWSSMDMQHDMKIESSRCPDLDGKVFNRPGPEVVDLVRPWLDAGVRPPVVDTQEQPDAIQGYKYQRAATLAAPVDINRYEECGGAKSTDNQFDRCIEIVKKLGWTKPQFLGWLQSSGHQNFQTVSVAEAERFISSLEGILLDKKTPF